MKPRIMAMISNAVQREPPRRRQRAFAQSPGPNSRAPYEPPVALFAVLITEPPSANGAATPSAAVARANMRLARNAGHTRAERAKISRDESVTLTLNRPVEGAARADL